MIENTNTLANLLSFSPRYAWSKKMNRHLIFDKDGDIHLEKVDYQWDNQSEWNEGLISVVNIASVHIFKINKKYYANWIIVSDIVLDILKTLDQFDADNNILSLRYHVYVNNNIPVDKIIVGFGDGTNPENSAIIIVHDIF